MLWTARTCSTKAERRFSPLGRAADGTALLMTGILDRRTPMPQTEEYYAALKVKGVPVKLLQFNEEFHGTGSKPSNYIRIRTPRENEAKVGHISSSLKIRDCASRACQLEDMQAGVRAIDDVDMASVVHVDVVRLDGDFAVLARARADAALIGLVRDRGDVEPDLFRIERIADVERARAGVEMGDEQHAVVVNRRHILVR